jgi:hypothetical protein
MIIFGKIRDCVLQYVNKLSYFVSLYTAHTQIALSEDKHHAPLATKGIPVISFFPFASSLTWIPSGKTVSFAPSGNIWLLVPSGKRTSFRPSGK